MATDFDGSTQFYSGSAVLTTYPCTMACWAVSDGPSGNDGMMSITAGAASASRLVLMTGNSTNTVVARANNNGGAATSTTFTTGVLFHACGVWVASNDRSAFLNGGGKGSTTNIQALGTTPDLTRIGNSRASSANDFFFDGRISWPCIWNVALTDAEVLALANGCPPWLIRPASIVGLWTLDGAPGTAVPLIGSTSLTATGSPTANDAQNGLIIVPRTRFIRAQAAAPVSGRIWKLAGDGGGLAGEARGLAA